MMLLTLAPLAWASAAPKTEAELDEWIEQGRGDEAYAALTAAQGEAGEGSLDYLIGLAALATGRNDEAVARLGAYVKRNPTEDPPRFELAHALERSGRRDEAIEQYRLIESRSLSAPNRQQAAADLARFEALPVIPVNDDEEQKPKPKKKEIRFREEKPEWGGDMFASAGYDSNPNMGPENAMVEHFFFFDLVQEQRTSESPFGNLGTSATFARPFNKEFSWRSAANVSAQDNPSAHFADSQNVNAQTALRWTGATQRLTGGVAYSVGWIGDREFDHEIAATALLEMLAPVVHYGFSLEGAQSRFPATPQRDVDSVYVRGKLERTPAKDTVWFPTLAVLAGRDEAVQQGSPFGRSVWQLSAGLARPLGKALQGEISADAGRSSYDGSFTQTEPRQDRRYAASAMLHWQLSPKSRWTLSGGGRYVRNRSNESLYDASRSIVAVTLDRSWGSRSSDPELLISPD